VTSQLRLAADDLITHPSAEKFNQLSRAVAALTRAGATSVAIQLGCCALHDIYARYEQDAAITVREREGGQIREAIASLVEGLPSLEVAALKQAIAEIDVNCASVGE
jgi:hypothetical protein